MTDPLRALEDGQPEPAVWHLVYADEIEAGTLVHYQSCQPDEEGEVEEAEPPPQIVALAAEILGESAKGAKVRYGRMSHTHRDCWATVLRTRREGGIVSMILYDEDGEQLPYVTHSLALVRVRS